MNSDRKDIADKLRQLAERVQGVQDSDEIDSLKAELMEIYEDLIRLNMAESKDATADEPVEQTSENTEMVNEVSEPPEPLSEEDEVIPAPTLQEETRNQDEDAASEEQEYPTLSDLFVPTFNDIKEDMSQKEEFKDTVSLEETEKLFETRKEEIRQLSLNDRLVSNSIQIGLNDRIAFVNKLFNFSQSDFNKVLTRLNTCSTRDEALHYVQYQVKTNYNWKGKEDLEERFISLIERKFMT